MSSRYEDFYLDFLRANQGQRQLPIPEPKATAIPDISVQGRSEHVDTTYKNHKRREFMGLGYTPAILEGRNLTSLLDPADAKDASGLQVFSMNAGNWDRKCNGDRLVDLIHSQWHIALYQESSSAATAANLRQERGLVRLAEPHDTCSILCGGSGRRVILNMYQEWDMNFCKLPRQFAPDDARRKTAAWYIAGVCASVNI